MSQKGHCEKRDRHDCDDHHKCVVDDQVAVHVEKIWKRAFPDSALLPVIGFPSNSGGVGTLTHTMGDGMLMKINGLTSRSPLANNALYSFECSKGKYINLYEIMLPDIPGKHGEISTVQYYTNLLRKYGLDVASSHYHFTGMFLIPEATLIGAIHHQSTSDLTPEEFSRRTIRALQKTIALINERSHH